MALSFEESKNQLASSDSGVAATSQGVSAVMAVALADTSDNTGEVVWELQDKYSVYSTYSDPDFSYVDDYKNIRMASSQTNLTQESNSQYIPFMINRYSDGVDLSDMMIQIHYVNGEGKEDFVAPVNVYRSSDKIKFGWVVSSNVTNVEGLVRFELQAVGANEKGQNYIWKTMPNGRFEVLKSLAGNGIVEPSTDWYTQFVTEMDSKIGTAMGYANQAAASAAEAKEAVEGVTDAVDAKINTAKQELADSIEQTKTELENRISGIDGLANFNAEYDEESEQLKFYNGETEIDAVSLSANPTVEWVNNYSQVVDNKISAAIAPVNTDLTDYKTANDARVSAIEESVGDLPETLRSDYYTKTETDALFTGKADTVDVDGVKNDVVILGNNIAAMQSSVDAVNNDLGKMQEQLNGMQDAASNEYDVDYTDSVFTFYENDEVKKQFTIVGGSGGGTVESSSVTITRLGDTAVTVISGESAVIPFGFRSVDNAGDDTGDAVAVWYVGNTKVGTQTVHQGENSFDVTKYVNAGDNVVKIQITDSMGTVATKKWTVNVVEFYLESIFDDSAFYKDDVLFRFTPYGSVEKTVLFELDGNGIGSITTATSGRQMSFTIPKQAHGAHLLKVYMKATINQKEVESDAIYKDIIWIDGESTVPAISCAVRSLSVKQYNSAAISYTVYDPATSFAAVQLVVDDVVVQTVTVDRTRQTWSFKSSDIGEHTLKIVCGETSAAIVCKVEDLGIDVESVTTNLAMDFNPAGHSNSDTENRVWTDGTNHMTVSDNFDWINGGYQIDDDNDVYFCVKAGTTATFDYRLFGDDAKKTGKNFKFVYKCTNVRDYDAVVLSCMESGIGVAVNAQKAELHSKQNLVDALYCEDNLMELEFNILPDAEYKEMVVWLDAIPTKVSLYSDSDIFTQSSPVGITVGSADCDVWVYRMKAYTMNLTDDEILDNHIADAKNADEMVARWMRNRIVNASGDIDPDVLAENCPDLRVIKISAPTFTTGKKNEIANTTVQQIYKNGRDVDNWTGTGSHKGQGTSSDNYGESARNIDFNCSGGFAFADGTTGAKYAMTENSVPEKYFNIKLNVASSENANNAVLADDHNLFNPHVSAAKENDPRVRYTMEFHPCVVFVQETDVENSTVFHDGKYHFYGCGDFGNSKKNNDTMGMDPENHKEFIVEIDNNTADQSRFLSDDLSTETWDGKTNFEFRYADPDCTEEELQAGRDAWQALLSWVVHSTKETFVKEFEEHFVKDSVLFDYLFTERHLMVDNRAKNKFFHTVDLVHWDLDYDYDND